VAVALAENRRNRVFSDLPEAELPVGALPATTPCLPVATVAQATAAPPMASQAAEEVVIPAGGIRLQHTPDLRMVLDIYANLAEARLEIDPLAFEH